MSRLHPSLIRISLHASLRSLADQFHSSFEVELHADEDEPATEELWRVGLPEELRLAIYRVVEEALSNVLKHTMATRVELRLDHPSEDRVTVTIRDNGSGFDVNTTTPGFGILSIQDYCGAVGGVLQIKSDVGEGTTISSSFPISTNNATATSPSFVTGLPNGVACASSSEGNDVGSVYLEQVMHQKAEAATTLLVVDDQPDYCGLVKELLKPYEEFQVVGEGHDGLDALRLVEELHPEAVLLDIEMPGAHGLDTAYEIHNRFPDVKVVLMSAYHQREYIEGTLPPGASDFIHKAEFSVSRLRQACRKGQKEGTPSLEYQAALR